jgi:hypothetical protein
MGGVAAHELPHAGEEPADPMQHALVEGVHDESILHYAGFQATRALGGKVFCGA